LTKQRRYFVALLSGTIHLLRHQRGESLEIIGVGKERGGDADIYKRSESETHLIGSEIRINDQQN